MKINPVVTRLVNQNTFISLNNETALTKDNAIIQSFHGYYINLTVNVRIKTN